MLGTKQYLQKLKLYVGFESAAEQFVNSDVDDLISHEIHELEETCWMTLAELGKMDSCALSKVLSHVQDTLKAIAGVTKEELSSVSMIGFSSFRPALTFTDLKYAFEEARAIYSVNKRGSVEEDLRARFRLSWWGAAANVAKMSKLSCRLIFGLSAQCVDLLAKTPSSIVQRFCLQNEHLFELRYPPRVFDSLTQLHERKRQGEDCRFEEMLSHIERSLHILQDESDLNPSSAINKLGYSGVHRVDKASVEVSFEKKTQIDRSKLDDFKESVLSSVLLYCQYGINYSNTYCKNILGEQFHPAYVNQIRNLAKQRSYLHSPEFTGVEIRTSKFRLVMSIFVHAYAILSDNAFDRIDRTSCHAALIHMIRCLCDDRFFEYFGFLKNGAHYSYKVLEQLRSGKLKFERCPCCRLELLRVLDTASCPNCTYKSSGWRWTQEYEKLHRKQTSFGNNFSLGESI